MRALIVAVTTAVVVVGTPVAAYAARGDNCPPGVATVHSDVSPTYAEISAAFDAESTLDPDLTIPPAVLRAIAYQESLWRQYDANGDVVLSSDTACGIGIMQVTAADDADPMRLATDWRYNVAQGAAILRAKWAFSQTATPPADTGQHDDPAVTENWYYAACLYNGCGTDETYPNHIAEIAADPFRRVDVTTGLKPFMPISGFTKPDEAKPGYALPQAFQARPGNVFVFYNSSDGTVTDTITTLPTHNGSDPPPTIAYGAGTYGPDGPGVTCLVCGGWRLAEGHGVAGRAHWTHSVTGAEGTRVTWAPALPRTGLYRVTTYIPDVTTDTEAMGTATYHLAGTTYAVDQAATAGSWVSLGDHTLSPGNTVWINDVSGVGGQRLVADGINVAALTSLSLTSNTSAVTYGSTVTLTARLTQQGTTTGLAGKAVRLYRRKVGATTWTYVSTYATNATGYVTVKQAPASNTDYQVTYTPSATDTVASASNVRRVLVRTRVGAALSRTSVPHGVSVTLSTSVAPNHAGQAVTLQRYYGGVWHGVVAKTLSASSTAAFAFAVSAPGTYYYRVYKAADADHIVSWSATLTLTVT